MVKWQFVTEAEELWDTPLNTFRWNAPELSRNVSTVAPGTREREPNG